MKKNKSTTTNTPQTTTHVQRENQTPQSPTGEKLIFNTKQIERMTTQQLRKQTKLRGIPISSKRKYFTSAKNLNSIYTHDRNMKKKIETINRQLKTQATQDKYQLDTQFNSYGQHCHVLEELPNNVFCNEFFTQENIDNVSYIRRHLENIATISPLIIPTL